MSEAQAIKEMQAAGLKHIETIERCPFSPDDLRKIVQCALRYRLAK